MAGPEAMELGTLATGLTFPESPRWHDGRVWVSDWGAHEVLAIDLDSGRAEVIERVPAFPLCIDFLPDGRLLIVAGSEGRILRQAAGASPVAYANLSGLATTPWNDIVVDGRGNAYVNNIGFDFPGGDVRPGFIALVAPNGIARSVADDLAFPNGMAITPDNRTLIVAESYANRLTAFDIDADGGLSRRRSWAEVAGPPDGICLDAENAVWYADVPNQRCVRVREGGQVAQTIELDRGCFSCALGGSDRRTLVMAVNAWTGSTGLRQRDDKPAEGQVRSARVSVPGAGWP